MKLFRSLFQKIKERWKEDGRPELCRNLLALGIQAHVAERGRPEEQITNSKGSAGIIDICDSPISWVNVINRNWWELMNMRDDDDRLSFYYEYGIPDPNLKALFPDRFCLGVIKRLPQGVSLTQPMEHYYDRFFDGYRSINGYPKQGCWVLTTPLRVLSLPLPIELWNSYEAIAQHLLESPISPPL